MELTVKVEGLDKIDKASRAVQESIANQLKIALKASGEKVRGEAIQSILAGNKSGKVYKRGNKEHRASAPGESPANDTGRLAGSIISIQNNNEALVIAGRGSVKYASMLEFGTEKMEERPFMNPALEKNRNWIIERLNKAVRDGVVKVLKK